MAHLLHLRYNWHKENIHKFLPIDKCHPLLCPTKSIKYKPRLLSMKSNQIFITLRRLNPASKVSVGIKLFYIRIVFEVRKGAGNIKIAFHASTAFKDFV